MVSDLEIKAKRLPRALSTENNWFSVQSATMRFFKAATLFHEVRQKKLVSIEMEPAAAGWEARLLPLCYVDLPPSPGLSLTDKTIR